MRTKTKVLIIVTLLFNATLWYFAWNNWMLVALLSFVFVDIVAYTILKDRLKLIRTQSPIAHTLSAKLQKERELRLSLINSHSAYKKESRRRIHGLEKCLAEERKRNEGN